MMALGNIHSAGHAYVGAFGGRPGDADRLSSDAAAAAAAAVGASAAASTRRGSHTLAGATSRCATRANFIEIYSCALDGAAIARDGD